MTRPIRYVMIGGFLGAGKTTAIARLARMYQERGQKVGLITNDQAADLVDTHSLRAQGFNVGEVAGACFCCHFNELTSTVERLSVEERPDVILAEPVGSCTDLVATVIQPLLRLFDHQYSIAPYAVILKPSHGRRILEGGQQAGFSSKAEYIFRQQLAEADLILLNRVDELGSEQQARLTELIGCERPDARLLPISAKTGDGFDELLAALDQPGEWGQRILDVDYDVYAEGEAELGWLNAAAEFESANSFQLDELLVDIIERLRAALERDDAETAHVKVIGLYEGFFGVANLVSRHTPAELSLPSHCEAKEVELVLNARVATDPAALEQHARRAIEEAAKAVGANVAWRGAQSFRPARPVPTHRFLAAGPGS